MSKEGSFMIDYVVLQKPPMIVIGIECRTSNDPDAGPRDIPKLWKRFDQEKILEKIPNKGSKEVVALYCDYEGDYTQPYSFVIGCPATSLEKIPEGMVAKIIPTGPYAVFRVSGEYPQSLINTWGKIWQTDLKRAYTGDYEIYKEGFNLDHSQAFEIYIAIKAEPHPLELNEIVLANQQKFADMKNLNLPLDQYVITGSGALGIRNLRKIGDIDILVTSKLWDSLAEKYGIIDENNVKKIVFPGGCIEVLYENSFYTPEKNDHAPTLEDRIACADIIEGLPFESLENVLFYKRKMGREKDLNDIFLIENLMKKK
jgi:predicted transcriptional regulator YdeE